MKDVVTLKQFKGIRNTVPAEELKPDDLSAGQNIDLDDEFTIHRRAGLTLFSTGAADSLFQYQGTALLRRSSALQRLNSDGTVTSLRTGIARALKYYGHQSKIYYSDGIVTGVIEDGVSGPWGITPPDSLPGYDAIAGDLPLGRYMYALTYIRDGEESGAGVAAVAEDVSGALSFTNIPVSTEAGVTHKALYVTRQNGTTLYRAGTIPNAQTTFTYSSEQQLDVKLETQFMQPAPACSVIAAHNSRMLVGVDRFLLYSLPYRFDLFDPIRMQIPFDSAVRMIIPVQGGIFVGTDTQIAYLSGEDVADASFDVKAGYGVVPGTLDYTDGKHINPELTDTVALFTSKQGICIAGDNGAFDNLTINRYHFDTPVTGAGKVIVENGKNRYLSILRLED
jgi:hypothetical protein